MGFFHRRIVELEPLLNEMDAQRSLYGKGLMVPAPALGGLGPHQRHRLGPVVSQLQCIKELSLTCAFDGIAQGKELCRGQQLPHPAGLIKHFNVGFKQSLPGSRFTANIAYIALLHTLCTSYF